MSDLTSATATIIAAYVGKHHTAPDDLIDLIYATYQALDLMVNGVPADVSHSPQGPAVPIGESVTDEFLICLEDGLKFRSLKRHLKMLGMTPDQYRTKWGLPASYPMAAPGYSAKRSELAKVSGLGRKRGKLTEAA